jgi:formylglycine-generating enzyme required for sulfatase activity
MSPDPVNSTTQAASLKKYRNAVLRKRLIYLSVVLVAVALTTVVTHLSSPPAAGTVKANPRDGQPYVWVPAGGFEAGCSKFDPDCSPEEKPAHQVTISKGFWIGQTEVTVAAYRRFAASTHRAMPPEPTFGDHSLDAGWTDDRMPIVNVDWNDSDAYCRWAGSGLPTEAQWEYAARAGNPASRYASLPQIAWFGDNSGTGRLDTVGLIKRDEPGYLFQLSSNRNTFHAVGLLAPNQFGLYDMLGNVWEWTADWYGESFYQGAARFDPTGQPNGNAKVLRGGSWTNIPTALRVSVRGRRAPATRSVDAGFRCVW